MSFLPEIGARKDHKECINYNTTLFNYLELNACLRSKYGVADYQYFMNANTPR